MKLAFAPQTSQRESIQLEDGNSRLPRFQTPELSRLIDSFCSLQYQAYRERLNLQPNGQKLVAALKPLSTTPEAEAMRQMIGKELLSTVSSLGKDPLKLFRAYGENLLTSDVLKPASLKDFHTRLICGVETKAGSSFVLSPDATASLASAIHESWMKAVNICSDPSNHKSLSSGGAKNSEQLMQGLRNLAPSHQNVNMLGGITLCKHLARLKPAEFDMLLTLAPDGNPLNLGLQMLSTTRAGGISTSIAQESGARVNLRQLNSSYKDKSPLDSAISERTKLFDQMAISSDQRLLQVERERILPAIYRSEEFFKDSQDQILLKGQLIGLRVARQNWITALRLAIGQDASGGLPDSQIAESKFEQYKLQDPTLAEKVADLESTYYSKSKDLATLTPAQGAPIIRVLSNKTFGVFENQISEMIDRHSIACERTSNRSGILDNYYDSNYWQTFLKEGGAIVVQVDPKTCKLQGFFAYCAPRLPQHLHEAARGSKLPFSGYTSHAELIMTATDSPRHTFRNLINAMRLDLALQGADYSRGLTYSWNQKALNALSHSGHYVLSQEAVRVDTVMGEEKMLPLILPINGNDQL